MFSIGDEVCVVDDSPYRCGASFELTKGSVFRVLGILRAGSELDGMNVINDGISIGILREFRWTLCGLLMKTRHYDFWDPDRFRKVEKKRDRAELYAMFGIDNLLTDKTPELTDAR